MDGHRYDMRETVFELDSPFQQVCSADPNRVYLCLSVTEAGATFEATTRADNPGGEGRFIDRFCPIELAWGSSAIACQSAWWARASGIGPFKLNVLSVVKVR